MSEKSPEIANSIKTGAFATNYHDHGSGFAALMLHGSGPGVSAYANWRLSMGPLSEGRRVIAPDLVGFGYTEIPEGHVYWVGDTDPDGSMGAWVRQLVDLLDALDIEQADIVGNSFGGALALAMAIYRPDRVRRLVLMGPAGVSFEKNEALEEAWGYAPSMDNMRSLLHLLLNDRARVTDELVKMRYEASIRPGVQEAYTAMFPAPRQRWVDGMTSPEDKVRALPNRTLILQGRDDQILPKSASVRLNEMIVDSQLHLYGGCGHSVQIEQAKRFNPLVSQFLDEE